MMTHEELRVAIRRMSLTKIMGFTSREVYKLTDGFTEDLVRDIVVKGETEDEQLKTISELKDKRKNARNELGLGPARVPEWLKEMELRIKFGLTIDSSNPPLTHEEAIGIADKLGTPSLNDFKKQEEENKDLSKQLAECPSRLKACEMREAKNDEWLVELFSHFCYEDRQVAKDIIDEMRDKTDPEIADIIVERKRQHKISPKTSNIDLWRVLHAGKLIKSNSHQNLDKALERREKKGSNE